MRTALLTAFAAALLVGTVGCGDKAPTQPTLKAGDGPKGNPGQPSAPPAPPPPPPGGPPK